MIASVQYVGVRPCSSGLPAYPSRRVANRAVRSIRRRLAQEYGLLESEAPGNAPKHSFRCELCNQFHLIGDEPQMTPVNPMVRALPVMPLPEVPTVPDRTLDPDGWRDAVVVAVFQAVRDAGGGVRFPGRQHLVEHFSVSAVWAARLRDGLVDVGLLVPVDPRRPQTGLVTTGDRAGPGQ